MGCGASSLNEDGSIKAGTRATKFASDTTAPVHVYFNFTDSSAKMVKCVHKKILITTELSELKGVLEKNIKAPYTDEGVKSAGSDNTFWLEGKPGVFMQQYNIEGNGIPSPLGVGSDIPHKLFGIHQSNPENLPKVFTKLNEKNKEHPYTDAENGQKQILADLESLKPLRTAHQAPDNFGDVKTGLIVVEDNIPMNLCLAATAGSTHLGTWDATKEAPDTIVKQVGLAEKAKLAIQAKLSNQGTMFSLLTKKDNVIRDFTLRACNKVCDTLKTTPEVFLPTVEPALDASIEARPGNARLTEFPKELIAEKTAEQIVELEEATIAKQWASDKAHLEQWLKDDDQPVEQRKAQWKKHVDEVVAGLKTQDDYRPKVGEVCLANFDGKGYFEGTVTAVDEAADVYQVEWPATKLLQKHTGNLKLQTKINLASGEFGKFVEKTIPTFQPLPKNLSIDRVYPSLSVRVRRVLSEGAYYFCNAVVEFVDHSAPEDVRIFVRDRYEELFSVGVADIWYVTSLESAARKGWILPQHYQNYSIWWIETEQPDDAVRELHLWREGAKSETLQVIKLKKQYAKAKPVKNEKGELVEPPYQVFTGYLAELRLLPYRTYCYSFKIDGDVYLNDSDKALNADAYKRLSLKLA